MANFKTYIGEWVKGLIHLKKENFDEELLEEIEDLTKDLVESILTFSKKNSQNLNYNEVLTQLLREWFDSIIMLKNSGYDSDSISAILNDIVNAHYYSVNDDSDYDDPFINIYNEDDEDDDYDDDDDDDDDFDPKKFFPRKK
jgi:copper homeostasis protein CutC